MSRGEGESAQHVFKSYVVMGRGELLLGRRISGAQAGQSLYCQAGLYGLWHTDLGVIHMGTEHEIWGLWKSLLFYSLPEGELWEKQKLEGKTLRVQKSTEKLLRKTDKDKR